MRIHNIRNIQDARENYKRYSGVKVENFFCPVLLEETNMEIIDGHIIPKSWNISNKTTPQAKQVDSFFGHSFQHETTTFQQSIKIMRSESPEELIKNFDYLAKNHKSKAWLGENQTGIYKPTRKNLESTPVDHTLFMIENDCFAIKSPPSEFADGKERTLYIDTIANAIDSYFATLLHSAHLTMFYFWGYKYVFSDAGLWAAKNLKTLYQSKNTLDRGKSICRGLVRMHIKSFSPLTKSCSIPLESTLISGNAFACGRPKEMPFGLMIITEDPINYNGFIIPWPHSTPFHNALLTYNDFLKSDDMEFNIHLVKIGEENSLSYSHSPANGLLVRLDPNATVLLDEVDKILETGLNPPNEI